LNHHIDYFHFNTVKHGLVEAVKDHEYSLFICYVKDGVYSIEWSDMSDISLIGEYGELFTEVSNRTRVSQAPSRLDLLLTKQVPGRNSIAIRFILSIKSRHTPLVMPALFRSLEEGCYSVSSSKWRFNLVLPSGIFILTASRLIIGRSIFSSLSL